MTEIPWGIVGSLIGGMATIMGALATILYKMINKRLADARQDVVDLRNTLESTEKSIMEIIKGHTMAFDGRAKDYFLALDRLRDKWEGFLTEYLKIDSTRGQKIEALFRVVDSMDEVVKSIPRQMNDKVEEAFAHAMSELKLYARELMSK